MARNPEAAAAAVSVSPSPSASLSASALRPFAVIAGEDRIGSGDELGVRKGALYIRAFE